MGMLGIVFYSYGHVICPPMFWFSYGKISFSHKIMPFFNGLIKKYVKGIKDGSKVPFWRGDARFHTQSILFTLEATFHMSRATKTPRGALFS